MKTVNISATVASKMIFLSCHKKFLEGGGKRGKKGHSILEHPKENILHGKETKKKDQKALCIELDLT